MSDIDNKHILFKGGVHPNGGKELSCDKEIQKAPLLDKYTVILQQHIGAPPKLIVKKGDEVKAGQLLATAGGFVSAPVHAPTSGTISAILDVPGAMGANMKAVEITADGKDDFESAIEPIQNWKDEDGDKLKQRIADAGIVGMGGAAFPAFVKLSPPPDKTIDTLILNGAECEPYLTADHRLMLEDTTALLEGAAMIAKVLNVTNIIIGVEKNKLDAIKKLQANASEYGIKIQPLRVRYPQGAEKQLIFATTGRKVPAGGLPMEVGCVVQNIGTAVAVKEAVMDGIPLIERVTTVTGTPVVNPCNWKCKIGTPISKMLEFSGGIKSQPAKVILGGPMMGFAQKNLDVTICKNSSGLLLLSHKEITQYASEPCIRCGRCVEACPMNLLPATISSATENEMFDMAAEYNVMDCMECGSCSYVCPARRPLVQHIKLAKQEIRNKGK